MIATLIRPIKSLNGSLSGQSGFYVRSFYGRSVIQHKPDRSGHVATPQERANRERFAEAYGKRYTKSVPNPCQGKDEVLQGL